MFKLRNSKKKDTVWWLREIDGSIVLRCAIEGQEHEYSNVIEIKPEGTARTIIDLPAHLGLKLGKEDRIKMVD